VTSRVRAPAGASSMQVVEPRSIGTANLPQQFWGRCEPKRAEGAPEGRAEARFVQQVFAIQAVAVAFNQLQSNGEGYEMAEVTVVGGGLSGSEAAWQLAERGHDVTLYEMRPVRGTEAHKTELLGEIVCSNTFKSEDPSNAHGLLKLEMDALGVGGSLLLACARESRIPGGTALTVDRGEFAQRMTAAIAGNPRIRVVREEVSELPSGPAIVATGPLTSDALSASIRRALGDEGLAFFDAIAPVVSADSLDMNTLFFASRWGKGEESAGDYLNAPMTREQYEAFVEALKGGEEHAAACPSR
jgi:methylenetetrahydrofolate--tRNA-(uracil-5-)-methyltransferase